MREQEKIQGIDLQGVYISQNCFRMLRLPVAAVYHHRPAVGKFYERAIALSHVEKMNAKFALFPFRNVGKPHVIFPRRRGIKGRKNTKSRRQKDHNRENNCLYFSALCGSFFFLLSIIHFSRSKIGFGCSRIPWQIFCMRSSTANKSSAQALSSSR